MPIHHAIWQTEALDVASGMAELGADRITQIYARFKPGHSLAQDFQQRFGTALDEDSLNNERTRSPFWPLSWTRPPSELCST